MRKFWEKLRQSTVWWLAVIVVLQSLVYVFAGVSKTYIHMDEAYSLALAQYDKIDITENADFYNTWHTDEYYQDYLAVQEKDRGDWRPVYENQKNDVHPPLYYILLRGAMELGNGRFSKWPGIILNILIMAGSTILFYLCIKNLFKNDRNGSLKSLVITLAAGLTVAGISTAVYIRMYALLTLMVLLTLWLHLKMREQEKPKLGMYLAIGIVVVLGVLTQYYYLFFLFGLAVSEFVYRVRRKQGPELVKYFGVLVGAGVMVLLAWPQILQHMFFGYRGQGVLGNLLNFGILGRHLWDYTLIVDYNVFHHLLLAVIIIIAAGVFYRRRKKLQSENLGEEFWLMLWPTLSYFFFAAVASPFIELRYIMPVCGLIFGLMMFGMDRVWQKVLSDKKRTVALMVTMLVILVAAPIQIMLGAMRVELLYRDRQAVMTAVNENPEAPILYFITTENNRFLDNILPFAVVKESYLALDLLQPTKEKVAEIVRGKDLGRGLFVFVSGSQDQDEALESVKAATGKTEVEFVQVLNTCNAYYLR